MALSLLLLMLSLCLALSYSGQQGVSLYLFEERHNRQERLAAETVARGGEQLGTGKAPAEGTVSLDSSSLTMNVRVDHDPPNPRPFKRQKTGFAHGDPLPPSGYQEQRRALGLSLPGATTAMQLESKLGNYRTVYSAGFPFGAYAPQGAIQVDSVVAVTNAGFDSSEEPEHSGLPVLLRARERIVTGDFPHGTAYSDYGPVRIKSGRGIPRVRSRGRPAPSTADDPYLERQKEKLDTAEGVLALNTVDKTALLASSKGPINSFDGIESLIGDLAAWVKSGDSRAMAEQAMERFAGYGSVQQSMMVPFVIIPVPHFKEAWFQLDLGAPYPPDLPNADLTWLIDTFQNQMEVLAAGAKVVSQFLVGDILIKVVSKSIVYSIEHGHAPSTSEILIWTAKELTDAGRGAKLVTAIGEFLAHIKTSLSKDLASLIDLVKMVSGFNTLFDILKRVLHSVDLLKRILDTGEFDPDEMLSIGLTFPPVTSADELGFNSAMKKGWTLVWPLAFLLENSIEDYLGLAPRLAALLSMNPAEQKKALREIFQPLIDGFLVPYRVLHFNGTRPDFYFPSGHPQKSDLRHWRLPYGIPEGYLSMKSTWSVPAGRTLKLRGNIQIRGDLWLQRGSVLHVTGDLRVDRPVRLKGEADSWPDYQEGHQPWWDLEDPFKEIKERLGIKDPPPPQPAPEALRPRGRVILEPGATLIVDGELVVNGGDSRTGSLLLTSEYGTVTPITSAVLCGGNVTLAHATGSGVLLRDFLGELVKRKASERTRKWANYVKVLETVAAPDVAKLFLVGPFETRTSFFAEYCLSIIVIYELPIPFPVPLLENNKNSDIFALASFVYAANLNIFLGENLFTHTDWWPYGRGVVPVLPKTAITPETEAAWSPQFDPAEAIEQGLEKVIEDLLTETLPELMAGAVVAIVEEAADTILDLFIESTGEGEARMRDLAKKVAKAFEKVAKEVVSDSAKTALQVFPKKIAELAWAALKPLDYPDQQEDIFFKELPGVLIHSGGSMRLGTQPSLSNLAAGLFVAEGDLNFRVRRTVGSVISRRGNIQLQDLHYYPYFTRAHLYDPWKPAGDVPKFLKSVGDPAAQALQWDIPEQKDDQKATWNIYEPSYQVTAEGWSR